MWQEWDRATSFLINNCMQLLHKLYKLIVNYLVDTYFMKIREVFMAAMFFRFELVFITTKSYENYGREA